MDPFTIACTTVSVLQGIKQISEFIAASGRVHEVLRDLKQEVDSLRVDVENVNNICQDSEFVPAAKAYQERVQSRIFTQLQSNLQSCNTTIHKLKELITHINHGGSGKLMNRGLTQLRFEHRGGECAQIRSQVQNHRGSLQLSVTALQFCMQIQSMKQEERAGKLMNIKMNNLTTIVESQSADLYRLRDRFRSSKKRGQQISDEDTRVLRDIEDIHESTLWLKSRAISDAWTVIKASPNIPGTPLQSSHEQTTPTNSHSRNSETFPDMERILLIPEQQFHASQSPISTSGSPRMSQTLDSSNTQLLNPMDTDVPTLDHTETPILRLDSQSTCDNLEGPRSARETLDSKSPITSVDFDDSITSTIAAAEQEKRDSSKPFKENLFSVIRDLLNRVGKHRWSERPRTYLVLRMIDQIQAMDGFVLEGLRDIHIPYTEERLPGCLASPSSRYAFLENQSLVMSSRAADLVCRGPHRHLSNADVHFTVMGLLGKGGQGTVDRVRDHLTFQEYARKRIYRTRTFARNKLALVEFEKEINTLKRLDHLHLVRLVGSYTDPKYVGLIMDPVADMDLKEFLMLDAFSIEGLAHLKCFFGCLSSAANYLHQQRCRHKDIKPGNILVKKGRVMITDFGTSLDWMELEEDATTGQPVAFTNTYAAPEVALAKPRNSAADLWSLGCVFLEIVTVLKGKTIEGRKRFFEERGTGSPYFHDNQEALADWIGVLVAKTSEHAQPLSWIRQMTVHDPSSRITAGDLTHDILSSGKAGPYYGQCCNDRFGSEEDSWEGSETDEEEGKITESVTKYSTASPAISWTSGTSSKLSQNQDEMCQASPSASSSSEPMIYRIPRLPWQEATLNNKIHEAPSTTDPLPASRAVSGISRCRTSPAGSVEDVERQMSSCSTNSRGYGASPPHSKRSSTLKTMEPISSNDIARAKEVEESAPRRIHGEGNTNDRRQGNARLPETARRSRVHSRNSEPGFLSRLQGSQIGPFSMKNPTLEAALFQLQQRNDGQLERYVAEVLKSDDQRDEEMPPLHVAVRFQNVKLAIELVRSIVGETKLPNVVDSRLNTPLHYAVQMKRFFLVKYLMSSGADVSCVNAEGQTPLHIAVTQQHASMVLNLLRHSPSLLIDVKDTSDRTALHLACSGGCIDIVTILLDHNAAIDPIDKAGKTPEMVSHTEMREEIAALLDQARESNVPDAVSSSASNAPGATALHAVSDPFPPPYITPSAATITCSCQVCKLIKLAVQMDSGDRPECLCSTCLERLAADTITDFRPVKNTLSNCSCETCVKSKVLIPTQCKSEAYPCAEDNRKEIDDELDHTVDTRYEAELQLESNQPPCDCIKWTTERTAQCVQTLSEGGFTQSPFELTKGQVLALVMDKYNALPNFVDVVAFLLNKGADIETKDTGGRTLLHFASMHGNIALAQMVLDKGANINTKNRSVATPLYFAVFNGRATFVYLLLRRGALKDNQFLLEQQTLLHRMIEPRLHRDIRNLEIMRILLRFRPKLDITDIESNIPLHSAIIRQDVQIASLLLEAGSYTEAPGKGGYKPLAMAIQSRNLEMVRLLLEHGTNVHCRCGTSPNALMYAAKTGGIAVFEEILSKSAAENLKARDLEGRTVMHAFALGDQVKDEIPDMLELLLENQVGLDIADERGMTPLHVAVKAGNVMMVSGLVDVGASEHFRNQIGKTPLDLAKGKKNKEMINILGGELKTKWYQRK